MLNMIEPNNHVKTKYLRRSISMKECGAGRNGTQGRHLVNNRVSQQLASLSKSADDILVDISHVTDLQQHGVVLYLNGSCQTDELRALVGSRLERTVQTYRARSHSFHAKTQGAGEDTTSSMAINGDIKTRKATVGKPVVHSLSLVTGPAGRGAGRVCVDRKDNPVQLRRCLSLYDRQRRPHSCCSYSTRRSPRPKPSPWAYGGGTGSRETRTVTRKSPSISSAGTGRKSTPGGSLSFDSLDMDSRKSSRMSVGSMGSADFDLLAGNDTSSLYGSSPVPARTKTNGRLFPTKVSNSKRQKPSQIPRPVRPQSAPPYKPGPASMTTVTKATKGSPTVKSTKTNRVVDTPLKRSASLLDKISSPRPAFLPRKLRVEATGKVPVESSRTTQLEGSISPDSLDIIDDDWFIQKARPVRLIVVLTSES